MKRLFYICYLIQWYISHFKERKYIDPACYREYLDNEYMERGVRYENAQSLY